MQEKSTSYTYQIEPRSADLGGGYRLILLENGDEVGGGVFPAEFTNEIAREDAEIAAYEWLNTRPDWFDELEDQGEV